jgi:hypothetical protein
MAKTVALLEPDKRTSDQVALAENAADTVTVKGVVSNVAVDNMEEDSAHGEMQVASLKMVCSSCK